MRFSWSPVERASNISKHGIDFADVELVDWSSALIRADIRFHYAEPRLIAMAPIGPHLHVIVFSVESRSVRIIVCEKPTRTSSTGMKTKLKRPTKSENAAINAGVARDADNPEWTAQDFAASRPTALVVPQLVRRRGGQKTPTKELISLRLDRDVLERL